MKAAVRTILLIVGVMALVYSVTGIEGHGMRWLQVLGAALLGIYVGLADRSTVR